MHAMKTTTNPRRLVTVPFSKTQCGVDFYINTGRSEEIRGVLTEHPLFRTDFFEFFFLHRARGVLLLGGRRIELHDGMVLLLSPHQQQRWLVDEAELDYTFLIFREDFMRTFLSDKFFVYRLLYCYQSDTPPWFDASAETFAEYLRLLEKIKGELRAPTSDITMTFSMALITFVLINYYGIRKKGVGGRIKSMAKPTPVVFPIKVVSDLAVPVSLACRLFGNMLGGMIVMDLLYMALGNAAIGFPSVLGLYFNVFHPLIQTYIFITLTLTFIGEAVE